MSRASRIATGVAGIAAVVLLFAGQIVGTIGSHTEPAFDASTQQIGAAPAAPMIRYPLIGMTPHPIMPWSEQQQPRRHRPTLATARSVPPVA